VLPVIAITPDCSAPSGATDSQYVVRKNYADALARAAALPVILPYTPDAISDIIERFDGFVISGTTPGIFEVPGRTGFERALIAAALQAGKPLLGICNGMQLLGIALGGTLIDDISAYDPRGVDHLPYPVPDQPAHAVDLIEGRWLHRLAKTSPVMVNSFHRQAMSASGNYHVAALARDGTVEAIEGMGDGFACGVQWHPEYGLTELDEAIFARLAAAAKRGT
jgi:gamma-glutamyl-gamma-aminobutyrate hydrolase PuuD